MAQVVSKQTLERLPTYLYYLKSLMHTETLTNISAKSIAESLGLGEIQVRKDLASVSSGGKPKVGYVIKDLVLDLEVFLGYNNVNDAVIIGAGKLGKALLEYDGFKEYGLNIVAAFDIDKNVTLEPENGGKVLPLETLKDFCKKTNIRIGIITVPAKHAQAVCDILVDCGVRAIWNFAPSHLFAPDDILVKNENMATSLAMLSKHLTEKFYDIN